MRDLNSMYLFAKVVEHGSYSAAARALGLQTSKLSRRISELEQQLGVRLLQRTTRKISVTEIGQSYYEHCAALEAQATAAQDAIDRTRSAPQGLVRISCPPALLQGPVAPILARTLLKHSQVRILVDMTNRRVDVVEEGFDIALRVRTPPIEDSNLAMRTLGESGPMLVASRAFLDRHGRPSHPCELSRFPTLGLPASGEKHTWSFREQDGTPLQVTHTPRLMTHSIDALREAAILGVGIAYLPQFVIRRSVERGELEHVLPQFALAAGVLHAVFPSRRGMVPAVRAVLDDLAEGLQEAV